MSKHFVVIDTETGGLDPATTDLLTLGATLYPIEKGGATFSCSVAHDPYRVSAGALRVNAIDLVQHHANAVDKDSAQKQFLYWLETMDARYGLKRLGGRIVLAGHNVAFDIGYLKQLFPLSFDQYFSHRSICTITCAAFLQAQGKLPEGLSLSLDSLRKHFGIDESYARHTALGDALATAELFGKLLAVVP